MDGYVVVGGDIRQPFVEEDAKPRLEIEEIRVVDVVVEHDAPLDDAVEVDALGKAVEVIAGELTGERDDLVKHGELLGAAFGGGDGIGSGHGVSPRKSLAAAVAAGQWRCSGHHRRLTAEGAEGKDKPGRGVIGDESGNCADLGDLGCPQITQISGAGERGVVDGQREMAVALKAGGGRINLGIRLSSLPHSNRPK